MPFLEQQMHSLWWPEVRGLSWEDIPVSLRKVTSDQWKHEAAHLMCIFPGNVSQVMWQYASFIDQTSLIPEEYGYVEDEIGQSSLLIVSASRLPNDFPVSYNCLKCARENGLLPVLQVWRCQSYRNPANTIVTLI